MLMGLETPVDRRPVDLFNSNTKEMERGDQDNR